jgi:hypothetical protein
MTETTVFYTNPNYYVGWLTLAMINAGLAQAKHRNGAIWFLISALTGPFATFLLVTFFSDKKAAT